MPTVIIRPTSTTSQTGWNQSNIHSVLGDNNTTTGVNQNNVSCNFVGVLNNLDASLSGATIDSLKIHLNAAAGRLGSASVAMSLVHSTDGNFASETESWTSSQTTQSTSLRTTQADGSTALNYTYINDCSVKIIPNTQGITAYELYVEISYTPASGYGNDVKGVSATNIDKINSVDTANIQKVNGV